MKFGSKVTKILLIIIILYFLVNFFWLWLGKVSVNVCEDSKTLILDMRYCFTEMSPIDGVRRGFLGTDKLFLGLLSILPKWIGMAFELLAEMIWMLLVSFAKLFDK